MTRVGTLLFWLAVFPAIAVSQEFCSLEVQVVHPSGFGLSGIPVWVYEADGRVEYALTENGLARFCGLGIRGVSVRAGHSCGEVTVKSIPLEWSLTRVVKIVYDQAPCLLDEPPPILPCSILFRFRDENGKWIPDVQFSPPLRRWPNLRSDEFGRAMVSMAGREELHVTAGREGYMPEKVDLVCTRSLSRVERLVTLRKAP
jgi:hypothetical protein